MAKAHVIVKRLASIENFGSMDVLCSDKTGTLTQGKVSIHSTLDARGRPSQRVLRYACLNASFESGFANPIDEALRRAGACERAAYEKLDELPYDFVRKRLSVLLAGEGRKLLITKGAFLPVLGICRDAVEEDGGTRPLEELRPSAERLYAELSAQGLRVLGVARTGVPRPAGPSSGAGKGHELPRLPGAPRPAQAGFGPHRGRAAPAGRGPQGRHRRQPPGGRLRGPRRGSGSAGHADRSRAAGHEGRGPAGQGRPDTGVRGGGAQPEGADHPGAAQVRARGRLPGGRDQRRLGAARRRRGHLGGWRRGRGPGRRGHRAAEKRARPCWCAGCWRAAAPSPTPSSTCTWPPAPTSATCSAWPPPPWSSLSCPCCPSRSCSPTC